ncbi:MAG: hypothetical protein AAF710_02600 [Planctomycetota bacterium]
MTRSQPAATPTPPALSAGRQMNALLCEQAAAMRRLEDALARYETLADREPWLTRGYTAG